VPAAGNVMRPVKRTDQLLALVTPAIGGLVPKFLSTAPLVTPGGPRSKFFGCPDSAGLSYQAAFNPSIPAS